MNNYYNRRILKETISKLPISLGSRVGIHYLFNKNDLIALIQSSRKSGLVADVLLGQLAWEDLQKEFGIMTQFKSEPSKILQGRGRMGEIGGLVIHTDTPLADDEKYPPTFYGMYFD